MSGTADDEAAHGRAKAALLDSARMLNSLNTCGFRSAPPRFMAEATADLGTAALAGIRTAARRVERTACGIIVCMFGAFTPDRGWGCREVPMIAGYLADAHPCDTNL